MTRMSVIDEAKEALRQAADEVRAAKEKFNNAAQEYVDLTCSYSVGDTVTYNMRCKWLEDMPTYRVTAKVTAVMWATWLDEYFYDEDDTPWYLKVSDMHIVGSVQDGVLTPCRHGDPDRFYHSTVYPWQIVEVKED